MSLRVGTSRVGSRFGAAVTTSPPGSRAVELAPEWGGRDSELASSARRVLAHLEAQPLPRSRGGRQLREGIKVYLILLGA